MPAGSVILASALPMHQLERRRNLSVQYPHMRRRFFDPQLYLAELDPNQSTSTCAKLGSYPWFGAALQQYSSSQQQQNQWMKNAEATIPDLWPSRALSDSRQVSQAIRECIDFQVRMNCQAIILPSPLTTDPYTDYGLELLWLDAGLDYAVSSKIDVPLFATIALSDLCLYYTDPPQNGFLDMVLDAVSARKVAGVYIVLEQSREIGETRHCSNARALWALLHLTHGFSQEAKLRVMVNFLGQFGLVCQAIGAEAWTSEWYKSTYRLRLADKIGGGRAYPSYWTFPAAIDVNLKEDFDSLNRAGIIARIADRTEASNALLLAAAGGRSCNSVLEWEYRQSNATAAREHYLRSSINADGKLMDYQGRSERLNFVEQWLEEAVKSVQAVEEVLGRAPATNTRHVQAWIAALRSYRADHRL